MSIYLICISTSTYLFTYDLQEYSISVFTAHFINILTQLFRDYAQDTDIEIMFFKEWEQGIITNLHCLIILNVIMQ